MKYHYNLARAPSSFDFLTWLSICATDAGKWFDVVLTPGPKGGFREDNLEPQSIEAREALLHNVVIPATRLFPVRNFSIQNKGKGKR